MFQGGSSWCGDDTRELSVRQRQQCHNRRGIARRVRHCYPMTVPAVIVSGEVPEGSGESVMLASSE